jgi:hypothetical protein
MWRAANKKAVMESIKKKVAGIPKLSLSFSLVCNTHIHIRTQTQLIARIKTGNESIESRSKNGWLNLSNSSGRTKISHEDRKRNPLFINNLTENISINRHIMADGRKTNATGLHLQSNDSIRFIFILSTGRVMGAPITFLRFTAMIS